MLPLPGSPAVVVAERYAVSLLPSFYRARPNRRPGGDPLFAGVGDPVYNRADPRYKGAPPDPSVELARLPGSAIEIQKAARIWREEGYEAEVLLGLKASTGELTAVVARHPGILHLAAHVVDGTNPHVALSLRHNGTMESLGPQQLSAFRVPGTLVMMAGCSSGRGAALPGVGLQGLTRAWMLSGAEAVVANLWPVPDDQGELAVEFYLKMAEIRKQQKLQQDRPGAYRLAWARALQQAMIEIRKGGRAPAATWAAYYLMGRN